MMREYFELSYRGLDFVVWLFCAVVIAVVAAPFAALGWVLKRLGIDDKIERLAGGEDTGHI